MFPESKFPPTAEEISQRFDFPAPEPFVRLLQFIHRETGRIAKEHEGYFDCITGLYLANWEDRYPGTPMELFPFGRPGVDGIQMGYVIHDPKLGPDFPIGSICPMDSDGVGMIGRDTLDGFDTLMSLRLKEYANLEVSYPGNHVQIGESRAKLMKAAAVLGIAPAAEKCERTTGWGFGLPTDGLGRLLAPLPSDWKLAMTADNLGVAAPAALFAPDQEFEKEKDGFDYSADYAGLAQAAEDEGYLGTALFHLRNAYWFYAAEAPLEDEFFEPMMRVYLALDRPLLAAHLKRHQREKVP